MKYEHAVAVGKFCPPHRGHQFLINAARQAARRVDVIVCAKPEDAIPGEVRGAWLRELQPDVHVLVIDDHYDADDSELWARLTVEWLGKRPDAVFTSEDYGPRYAAALGCEHVLVDRQRLAVPCSGTAVRNDPFANWAFIDAPLRAWYAKRIIVVGAESTGTTTLAQALAQHYRTVWVPEYGREYSEQRLRQRGDAPWSTEEFTHIALEQNRRENAAARMANRLLIGDTDAFATTLWHRRYMGAVSEEVERAAAAMRPRDLYLLTGDEIPFVQDGLRDGETIRHDMHGWFAEALARQSVPHLLVRGPHLSRFATAVQLIDALFHSSQWKPGRED
jgi:HTH-type transcriptional repressor of NAD biosynthesis genes